jgi:hypothetical protein
MDERSFAELSKRVAAAAESRRGLLEVLVASLAGTLGIGLIHPEATEAAFGYCKVGGFPCGKNDQCCTNKCLSTGVCGCAKKGKPCINRVGINCCSRKCRKGKCK